jgi:hypothetical protein
VVEKEAGFLGFCTVHAGCGKLLLALVHIKKQLHIIARLVGAIDAFRRMILQVALAHESAEFKLFLGSRKQRLGESAFDALANQMMRPL